MINTVIHGDCLEEMKKLADKNKVSVVVIVKTILENVIDEVEIV